MRILIERLSTVSGRRPIPAIAFGQNVWKSCASKSPPRRTHTVAFPVTSYPEFQHTSESLGVIALPLKSRV